MSCKAKKQESEEDVPDEGHKINIFKTETFLCSDLQHFG